MTYKELLEYCKARPGCLSRKEQKEADSVIKYRLLAMNSYKKIKK